MDILFAEAKYVDQAVSYGEWRTRGVRATRDVVVTLPVCCSWGEQPPEVVLEQLVTQARSGQGFVIWGASLVLLWLESLCVGQSVYFSAAHDPGWFMLRSLDSTLA
jgi:hypothetical protein